MMAHLDHYLLDGDALSGYANRAKSLAPGRYLAGAGTLARRGDGRGIHTGAGFVELGGASLGRRRYRLERRIGHREYRARVRVCRALRLKSGHRRARCRRAPRAGFSITDPSTWPFELIPVPEIATDPNEGTTAGLLPVLLFNDEHHQIHDIIAPDMTVQHDHGSGGKLSLSRVPFRGHAMVRDRRRRSEYRAPRRPVLLDRPDAFGAVVVRGALLLRARPDRSVLRNREPDAARRSEQLHHRAALRPGDRHAEPHAASCRCRWSKSPATCES